MIHKNGTRTWSKEEQEYLVEHFPYQRSEEIAKALGRSKSAVEIRAGMLGLKKKMKFCIDCERAFPRRVRSNRCEECRRKRAKGRKKPTGRLSDDPFKMTFNVLSGWQIVYGENPKCRSCGKEIKEGQIARWRNQKIYHDSCLGAQKEAASARSAEISTSAIRSREGRR